MKVWGALGKGNMGYLVLFIYKHLHCCGVQLTLASYPFSRVVIVHETVTD